MNWDAIGATGEVLGSLVVLITLAYLAAQVRHARSLLKVSVQSMWLQSARDSWLNRIQSPELVDAILETDAILGEGFSLGHPLIQWLVDEVGLDRRKAYMICADQIASWQNWVTQIEHADVLAPDVRARLHASIRNAYGRGYAKRFWEFQRRANVEVNTIRYIEDVLARSN